MPHFDYLTNYWGDVGAKRKFIRFTKIIHGLDFTQWDNLGYWYDAFVPFSFFKDGQLVASTCVYLLPMKVQGQDVLVSQFSSVGTLPEYRKQGLNQELTRRALAWCEKQNSLFSCLYADDDAVGFYQKCGFRKVTQSSYKLKIPAHFAQKKAYQLDPLIDSDRQLIFEYAQKRSSVSNQLACKNANLLMFHALYRLRDCIYHLPEINAIVFAKVKDETLHLYDLLSEALPELTTLIQHLPLQNYNTIEFHFMPDRFDLDQLQIEPESEPSGIHVIGDHFPFENQDFLFPLTVHA